MTETDKDTIGEKNKNISSLSAEKNDVSGSKADEFITVVMIANDTPEAIKRSLESISRLALEKIFIDTGCSAEALDVARSFDCEIHSFDLEDDMSAARNFGISKATKEWIMILDTDEILDNEASFKLAWLIKNSQSKAFFLEIYDLKTIARIPQIRLFKNEGTLKYFGRFGEYLDAERTDLPEDYFANSSAIIHHLRREDRELEKVNVLKRTKTIKKLLLRNKDDYFLLQRLAMDLEFMGDYKEAIQVYKQLIDQDRDGMFPLAARNLAICLEYDGKGENALKILNNALKFYSDYTDLAFEAGMIFLKIGELEQAIRSFKNCIDQKDSPIYFPSIPGTGGVLAEFGIALAGQLQGKVDEAGYVIKNAMEQIQENALQLMYLGSILKRMYPIDMVIEIFLKIANMDNESVQKIFQELFTAQKFDEVMRSYGKTNPEGRPN